MDRFSLPCHADQTSFGELFCDERFKNQNRGFSRFPVADAKNRERILKNGKRQFIFWPLSMFLALLKCEIRKNCTSYSERSRLAVCDMCVWVSSTSHFETKTDCWTFAIVATTTLFWSAFVLPFIVAIIKLYVRTSNEAKSLTLKPTLKCSQILPIIYCESIFKADFVFFGRQTAKQYLVPKTNAIWCTDRTQGHR